MNNTPVKSIDTVSIIIPAYNEAPAIRDTIENLLLITRTENWEVLVINNGSTDDTTEILKNIKGIKLISHPYNKGYGAALKTGIISSIGEIMVFFDADNQHDPKDIKKLLDNFENFDISADNSGDYCKLKKIPSNN